MELTRISTAHYNGQSKCQKCGTVNWSCMMVEFKEIEGHYCHSCAETIEQEQRKNEN